jgi:hypothetical protein
MRYLATAFVLVAGSFFAGMAQAGPDCTCRYAGADFHVGTCTCITIGGKAKLACCGMVLNNTGWKFGEGICPVAESEPDRGIPADTATGRPAGQEGSGTGPKQEARLEGARR